ncbi:MAG: DUF5916 domain-containing protein [Candidatus Solibacter sp.]|nr:DUF5916 domain-containing protein [Candidatus Solibacter sp.]
MEALLHPTHATHRVARAPKLADFVNGVPRERELAISDFRQMDPTNGAPVSQPTTAYLSFDTRNLYVGWICKDDPAKVRARIAKRKDIESDDRVTINIDTFHDHKHAYWFDVNPYAIQFDGITTDGQGDDRSFETLWYTEAQFTADGYVVLQTIPFRSMRFPNAPKQVWGVMLGRFIYRNNEFSMWPFVSRSRFPQFVGQFADMEIAGDISPGRNLQFIPYGLFSNSRYLDRATGFKTGTEARGGLDARMVLKDAFTLDLALNPDFSQVESDEPQVTVNQRYEVFFPEKRPFFMEKASLFNTPEQLFFSRRIVDPQFGARLTGTVGRWSLGVLAADDRAPGKRVAAEDSRLGNHAVDGVFRVEREFGRQSHVGALVTSYNFGSNFNQVASLDTRIELGRNWTFLGQGSTSETRSRGGARLAGPGYYASLRTNGLHFQFVSTYTDRSPGFRAALGYIPRVDIREWTHTALYRWRPKKSFLVSFGPGVTELVNWNREGQVQDWLVRPSFAVEMRRATTLRILHTESFELFQKTGFRKNNTDLSLSTEWYRWLALSADYNWGKGINYYPGSGLRPFLAQSRNASLGLTIRPQPRLSFTESYIHSRLGATREWLPDAALATGAIFNNHILRSKVNYQFSRELSLRAIFDYNGVLPNCRLVPLDRSKRLGADVLLTYLLHPGTALYIGYSNVRENLAFDPLQSPALQRTAFPDTATGRQVFIKLSYLLRY